MGRMAVMRITALAGGIGGARFLRGLRDHLTEAAGDHTITVVGNVGDDIWLFGLKVSPDLDTVMYTLGGGIDEDRAWGRSDETFNAAAELKAYKAKPDWFGLGDRDLATHLIRTQMLEAGYPLSTVTAALCARWQPGVELLPASDERLETHVVVEDGDGDRRAMHFQEWWVRHRASLPAEQFIYIGADEAKPAPGVLEAIAEADVVVLPPSNPVVSIGAITAIPGISAAISQTSAPVVGVSGIVAGAPVRGMADKCLEAIGVSTTSSAVALHYGARPSGLLDGWLVDTSDADQVDAVNAAGIRCRAVPTLMTDRTAAVQLARATLELAGELAPR